MEFHQAASLTADLVLGKQGLWVAVGILGCFAAFSGQQGPASQTDG